MTYRYLLILSNIMTLACLLLILIGDSLFDYAVTVGWIGVILFLTLSIVFVFLVRKRSKQ